jgi:RimJ/RimL family protein N-acetyltransferase
LNDLVPFPPIRTPRLLIRPLVPDDAAPFAAYRDDPETARYQDWDLPYSVDDALRMIRGQDADGWPVRGEWLQLAIEHRGSLVGDVAVGLSDDGASADIGYTLSPTSRGQGFAIEAVSAVLERLRGAGISTFRASVDPANAGSIRLLDRLGFNYVGRSERSTLVRGEWVDDDHYELT